jgi:hypothetical protein
MEDPSIPIGERTVTAVTHADSRQAEQICQINWPILVRDSEWASPYDAYAQNIPMT